jgi:hypothetical protein
MGQLNIKVRPSPVRVFRHTGTVGEEYGTQRRVLVTGVRWIRPVTALAAGASLLFSVAVAIANPDVHSANHSYGGTTCNNLGYSLLHGVPDSGNSYTYSSDCSQIYAEVYIAGALCTGGWVDEYSGWVLGGFAGESVQTLGTFCAITGGHRISIAGVDVSATVITDTSHPVH